MDTTVTTSQRTILYIEDDPSSRLLVERALRHAGYRVVVAERGLEGIDLARRENPDLIITDINLPDLSGREVTTTLRSDRRFAETPIVALTAQGYGQHRALALAAGVTGYMTKPVDVEALKDQVEYYLGGGSDQIDAEALADAQTRYAQEVVQRLEKQIRDLEGRNDTLVRLDKMKDSFIQVTAHELRTPLTLVYGYSKLLSSTPALKTVQEEDETLRTMLKGLEEGIKRMQDIVNEIVIISRIMTNQIELSIAVMNPGLVAERVAANYQEAIKQRNISLHFNRANWPDRMRADADLIALMFSNLLSNAIKYTPDGGQIFLIAQQNNDDCIQFSVKDTGIGIAPDEFLNIFEKFHTGGDWRLHSTSKTAFQGGGLGLGLAVCKGIVEAHGGQIRVESAGRDPQNSPGSEFIVTLPVTTIYQKPTKL
jgi:signal transduction histidine kinase